MTLSSFASFAVAFACNLHALSQDERVRHARNTERLRTAVLETRELESGYRFRVAEPGMDLGLLARAVGRRRREGVHPRGAGAALTTATSARNPGPPAAAPAARIRPAHFDDIRLDEYTGTRI